MSQRIGAPHDSDRLRRPTVPDPDRAAETRHGARHGAPHDSDRLRRPTVPDPDRAADTRHGTDLVNRRIAAIARQQHGIISRRQLLACGLSPAGVASRARRSRLFPVVRGVFALSPHVDVWGQRHAAVVAVGTAAPVFLSHWSAAQAHGLVAWTPRRHHVTIHGTGSRRAAAVQIHRARTLHGSEVGVVEQLPITSPARTVLDCAARGSVEQIRRLIREAEYQGLLASGAMAAAVALRPRHPGSAVVRKADPQTAEAALDRTPLEDRVADVVRRLPLPDPLAQYPLVGASGRRYRADFAWPDFRMILEADGRSSHDRSSSFHSDRERDADLAAVGWMTLRVTALQLRDPARVVATIVATARTRATTPPDECDADSCRP